MKRQIKVGVNYYIHPETKEKVIDFEGMREDFECQLDDLHEEQDNTDHCDHDNQLANNEDIYSKKNDKGTEDVICAICQETLTTTI